jgi:hypothetical protein
VIPVGGTVTADLFIVNEKDIKGDAEIDLQVSDHKGTVYFSKKQKVKITGGAVYGELLLQGIQVPVNTAGYSQFKVTLRQGAGILCKGDDELFAVKRDTQGVSGKLVVADTSGMIQGYLRSVGINTFKSYTSGKPDGDVMVVGAFEPQQTGNPLVTDVLEWVNNGNTLVIISNYESWAPYLAKKEVIDFRGLQEMGRSWYGGNYFVKESALFKGLQQSCVFNWEYQCLATYNKKRFGMRLYNGETIVGSVSDHKQEVYSALSVINHGRGKIILNALDISSCLKTNQQEKKAEGDGENAAMNTFNAMAGNPANIVGQQLLLNLLKGGNSVK